MGRIKMQNKQRRQLKNEEGQKKSVGVREIIRRIFFWIALIVFIVSLTQLLRYAWTYYSANKGYGDLWSMVTGSTQANESETPKETESAPPGTSVVIIGTDGILQGTEEASTRETEAPTKGRAELDIFPPDYPVLNHALLKQINPDYIGYINIPGTYINYPIVQGNDNSHYLRYDFEGREIISGCPFMDYSQAPDFSEMVSTVCAHNQKDNKMFGTLNYYADKSFWEENPYVYIITPEAAYQYKVFACYDQYYVSFIFGAHFDEAGREALLQHAKENALYDTGVEVTTADHILTLYTCTNDGDYRFVVHAVCTNYE